MGLISIFWGHFLCKLYATCWLTPVCTIFDNNCFVIAVQTKQYWGGRSAKVEWSTSDQKQVGFPPTRPYVLSLGTEPHIAPHGYRLAPVLVSRAAMWMFVHGSVSVKRFMPSKKVKRCVNIYHLIFSGKQQLDHRGHTHSTFNAKKIHFNTIFKDFTQRAHTNLNSKPAFSNSRLWISINLLDLYMLIV